MIQMFPLLVVSLVIYAVLTLTNMSIGTESWRLAELMNLPLASDDVWVIRGGDVFLVGSMGLLFVELERATNTDTSSLTNHALSFILFIVCLLLFIFFSGFGNSTFFIYMSMTFLDPMAGIVVTTVTARRDFSVAEGVAR
ncbi:MAG: hypothetical protein ACFB00_12555 [Parvularculaceae bacterium]